jgi:hypothetical protein
MVITRLLFPLSSSVLQGIQQAIAYTLSEGIVRYAGSSELEDYVDRNKQNRVLSDPGPLRDSFQHSPKRR